MDKHMIDMLFTFIGFTNLLAFGLAARLGLQNRKLRRANLELASKLFEVLKNTV